MTPVHLYTHTAMLAHDPGEDHPERPERLAAVLDHLRSHPSEHVRWHDAEPVADDALTAVHDPGYVALIRSLEDRRAALDTDTTTSPGSTRAARLAAGAAVQAVDRLMNGDRRAFCLVRPPGHHAERRKAMGFCLWNNVAVAAQHARTHHGVERVLVVDWDVHHGNGTQHMFEDDPGVLFVSSHRWPFYPGSGTMGEKGRGAGLGTTINLPMPSRFTSGDLFAVYREAVVPAVQRYQPQLVLISAGFDAHRDDPLGDARVDEEGFASLCGLVLALAEEHADGRVAALLEGGYDLDATARSVAACVDVLAGRTPPGDPEPTNLRLVAELARTHAGAGQV